MVKCHFIEDFLKEDLKILLEKSISINLVDIDKAINSKKLDPLKEINKDVLVKAGLIRKNTIGYKIIS